MSADLADTMSVGHVGRLIGKFRLDRLLGQGAMGEVFLGVHVELGNFVAVKFLSRQAGAEVNGVERFLNEAKAVAAIDHENVAKIIDQDRLADGTPYIVMEYVDGKSLREVLHARPMLPLRTAVDFAVDTLSALQVAHGKGIVHRDLKPENLRVTPGGRIKVLDFGVAKLLHSPTSQLTEKGAIVGTPHYMAPEQVLGLAVDGRVDLYAVGVMLFECVTGHRPFEGQSLVELLKRQVDAAPPWPSKLRADLPPALEQVILRALEKSPELRFASALDMNQALRAIVPSLPLASAAIPAAQSHAHAHAATPNQLAYVPTRPERPAPALASPQPAQPPTHPLPTSPVPTSPIVSMATAPADVAPRRWPLIAAGLGALLLTAGLVSFRVMASLAPSNGPAKLAVTPVATVVPPSETTTAAMLAPAPAVPKPEPEPTPEPVRTPSTQPPGPKSPTAKKLSKVAAHDGTKLVGAATPEADAGAVEPPTAANPPSPSGVTKIETGRDRVSRPIDFDPKNFDAVGFLPEALALARQRMSDAVLIDFSVDGVFADGHVDLSLTKDFEANYFFRSPSRSISNPVLPDDAQEIRCLTYVVVSAKHVEVFTTDSFHGCHEAPLPKISCPLPKAAKAAVEQGGLPTRVAKASWLRDGWYFSYGDEGPSFTVLCR